MGRIYGVAGSVCELTQKSFSGQSQNIVSLRSVSDEQFIKAWQPSIFSFE